MIPFKQLQMVNGVAGPIGVPVTEGAQWYAKGSVRVKTGQNAPEWTPMEYREKLNAVILKSVMVSRKYKIK